MNGAALYIKRRWISKKKVSDLLSVTGKNTGYSRTKSMKTQIPPASAGGICAKGGSRKSIYKKDIGFLLALVFL